MSASDSDYSIDWLASDEDDTDDPDRSSPDRSSPPGHPDDDTDGPDRSSPPGHPEVNTDGPDRSSPRGHPDDDTDGPDISSPPRRCPDAQPPPTSTTCLRDPPRNRVVRSAGSVDKKSGDDDSDSKDGHQHCRLQSQCSNNNGSTDDSSDCSSSPVSKQNFWASPVQGYTTTRVGQQIPSRALRSTSGVIGKPLEMRKRFHGPGHCETSRSEDTDKELFSRKCTELQCYVQPLSSILRGLRSGRYSQRLSGFQESVAMDRIQRIMGVLQKPVMGERFLNIVLKMEAMLHSWFPEVKRRAEQQHTDHVTPAKRQKHHTTTNQSSSSARPVASGATAGGPVPGSFSAAQVRWVHTSPACSLKTSELPSARTTPAAAAATPHPSRGVLLQATQDNVVSSSTDLQNGPKSNPPHGRGAVPFKISSPCLQRLLQAKESIIGPRTVGDDGTL